MTSLSDGVLSRLASVVSRPQIPGGRYEIVEEVGSGGMGTVYRALDRELDREVAIKVSRERRAGRPSCDRLREEAKTVAALEHPSITPVHDVGELADGRPYYVMRFVHGPTLARASIPSPNAKLRVFLSLCEALAHAHGKGLVHRDLKPTNVMLGEHGELYVMDWGIARGLAGEADPRAATESPAESPAESVGGTPGFMAPEQANPGSTRIDARADVYALGGILAFLATDRGPSHDGRIELAGVPRALAAIVGKARRAEPEERYTSAAELARDVAAFLDRESVSAYRERTPEKAWRFLVRHQFVVWLVVGYLTLRLSVLLFYGR